MTERKIQDALYFHLWRKGYELCVPNYTPQGWWECDLFALSKAGYSVEFEIKLSVADFKADARKVETFYELGEGMRRHPKERTKHELLASKSDRGPSRFCFVVPEGLLTAADVPKWAGLFHAYEYHRTIYVREEKRAPKLHGQKVSDAVQQHCRSVFYHRYWRLRMQAREISAEC